MPRTKKYRVRCQVTLSQDANLALRAFAVVHSLELSAVVSAAILNYCGPGNLSPAPGMLTAARASK